MNLLIKFLMDRLKERSTWVGIVAVAASFGIQLTPEMSEAVISAGLAIGGVIMMVFADMAKKADATDKPKDEPKGE